MHSASKFRVWPLVATLLSTGVSAPVYASEPKKPTPPSPAPAPARPARLEWPLCAGCGGCGSARRR